MTIDAADCTGGGNSLRWPASGGSAWSPSMRRGRKQTCSASSGARTCEATDFNAAIKLLDEDFGAEAVFADIRSRPEMQDAFKAPTENSSSMKTLTRVGGEAA